MRIVATFSLVLLIAGFILAYPIVSDAADNPKVTKKLEKVEKFFSKGDAGKALSLLESLAQDYADDPRPAIRLARYYLESKLYNDAIRYAQQAHSVNADNQEAKDVLCESYQGIGQMKIQMRQLEQAEESYKKMIELCPTKENKDRIVFLFSKKAEMALQQKKYPEAISAYENILTYQPENQQLYLELFRLYYSNGQEEEAVQLLEKGIDQFPEDETLTKALGALYFKDKKYEEAKNLFGKSLERDPNNLFIASYYAYAVQSIAHEKFNALKEEDKLPKVTLKPGKTKASVDAYKKEVEQVKQEMLQIKEEIYRPVLDAFDKAIAIDTEHENPKLILNLAVLHGFIGNQEKMKATYLQAGDVYKKLHEEHPEDIGALQKFGFCLLNAGENLDEAATCLQKVIELDTESQYPTAYLYLGEIFVDQKKYDDAQITFRKFKDVFPTHPGIKNADQWLQYIEDVLSGTDAGNRPMKLEISEPVLDFGSDDSEGLSEEGLTLE